MLTREDRNAIDGLFERLAEAERSAEPRDAEAEALIRQKIAQQPNSPYYLAQTVVVQQEALNEAERRIEALEEQLNGGDRRVSRQRGPWDNAQPGYGGGGFLAGAAILLQLVGEALAFVEAVQLGPLNRGDVDEHVLAAIFRLDETIALGGVEPFNSTDGHLSLRSN